MMAPLLLQKLEQVFQFNDGTKSMGTTHSAPKFLLYSAVPLFRMRDYSSDSMPVNKPEILLTSSNNNMQKITMNPMMPETITINIQPESKSDHHLNGGGNGVIRSPTKTAPPFNAMATLKPCDSAPSFGQMGGAANGDMSDIITLNSANSSNSLLPRDELYLQQQQRILQQRRSDPELVGILVGSSGGIGCIAHESSRSIAIQVFFPFLVAGLGMVGAGLLLDTVQHWEVFRVVSEIMVLVPSLLGLKGNLEMTLAARLSTQANLGTFDKKSDQLTLIAGNMALIECQAIVVGFLASWFAILIGFFTDGQFDLDHAFLLCASSIMTAAAASILLGFLMVGVIICSRKFNINPDNVATPIAASLGDVTSLAILAGISTLLYGVIDKMVWAGPIIIVAFLSLIPILVVMSRRNRYTEDALRTGWVPVITAMIIASIAGFIFDIATARFNNIAVFQPVVNGVGGNLVAIHASRISTSLHTTVEPGSLPSFHPRICVNPCATFFSKDMYTKTARVLMLMVIPGHLIFAYLICYVKTNDVSLTFSFVSVYLLVSVIQVAILLYASLIWNHLMWKRRLDPDNCSIPYLTALGDLLGVGLLTVGFLFLALINEEDIGVGY